MSEIERLLRNYERHVRLPWQPNLAGAEKVWFAVYNPNSERRLRLRLPEFEMATRRANHGWKLHDVTDSFGHWLARQPYLENYWRHPGRLAGLYSDYLAALAQEVTAVLSAEDAGEGSVVALSGLAALFGIVRVSALIEQVESSVRGRLLVFFPGEWEGNHYRFLDARDGWNYRAVPITASEGL